MATESVGTAQQNFGTHQKALRINLDKALYGTFAEIGAARKSPGGSSASVGLRGTVAKTISAYDMQVSDAIYGKSERYVGRLKRLFTML